MNDYFQFNIKLPGIVRQNNAESISGGLLVWSFDFDDIAKDECFSKENIWVKRPGTGQIKAEFFEDILNKKSTRNIKKNEQLKWEMIND